MWGSLIRNYPVINLKLFKVGGKFFHSDFCQQTMVHVVIIPSFSPVVPFLLYGFDCMARVNNQSGVLVTHLLVFTLKIYQIR